MRGRFGLHYFSHKRTDWTSWFELRKDRDKAYDKAKGQVGTDPKKSKYRYVKKVER